MQSQTQELCFNELLIQQVQDNPCLYNMSLSSYKDVKLKENVWKSISQYLGVEVETCTTRWRSLRDRLTKEKNKIKNSCVSGSSASTSSKLEHFQNMTFLLDHLKHKVTVGNLRTVGNLQVNTDPSNSNEIPIPLNDGDDLIDLVPESGSEQPCNTPLSSITSPQQHSSSNRKRKRSDRGEFQDRITTMLHNNMENVAGVTAALHNAHDEQNEFSHLGKQVAETLRSLPRVTAYEAASHIMGYLADKVKVATSELANE